MSPLSFLILVICAFSFFPLVSSAKGLSILLLYLISIDSLCSVYFLKYVILFLFHLYSILPYFFEDIDNRFVFVFVFVFFILQVLISHQFYTHQCIHVNSNRPIHHTTIPTPPWLSPLGVHTFFLYICVSTSALQTGSSVPFF